MNAIQTLLTDHLDLWTAADTEKKSGRGRSSGNADRVYGIRKLRELILELAVRGKLVPQDANDEPAKVLLKRIQAEKDGLITAGKIKKDKPLPPIADDDKPFDLPPGWVWVRLGDIAETIRGVTYGKSDASDIPLPDYVPLLRGNNINRFLNFDSPVFVPKQLLNEAQYVRAGDIVIAMSSGSADLVGKAAQATEDFSGGFGAFCGVIRSVSAEIHSFFGFFFQTPLYRNRAAGHGKGIGINNLQKTALQTLEIPLPPLAEQHRIVAKVDELMVLCDQLEQQQTHSLAAHQTLVETLLGTLTRVASQQEFSAAWARIASHFDTLFTSEASIDQLKQTILQLAVMGKLVPQDPNDEPAKELIDRISEFREQSFAGKRAKAPKTIRDLVESESDHDIPDNWAWCRLGDLVLDFRYGTSRKCSRESSGVPVLRIPNIQNGRIDSTDLKFTDMPASEYEELRLREGDLLLVRSNGSESLVGRSAVASADDERFAYAGYLVRARIPREIVFSPYLHVALSTPSVRSQIEDPIRTTSGVKNINTTELSNLVLSLPPLAEQHRIVAKVEELMALCDTLKARLAVAQTIQLHLADAIVEQAVC